MADSDITAQELSTDLIGNCLWDTLPIAVCADVLAQLAHSEFVSMSLACQRWRTVVQSSVTCLAPRSVLAMHYIGGCSSLRQLDLGHAVPTRSSGPISGFSCIKMVTNLTYLSMATSNTALWQGRAARLTAADLQDLTALRLLKVLSLSHQQLLSVPGALLPLSALPYLTHLSLDTSGDSWHLPYSSWRVIADLATLRYLDLTGCSMCWLDHGATAAAAAAAAVDQIWDCSSSSSSSTAGSTSAAAAAAAGPRLVPAPLHQISALTQLQTLILAHWLNPPSCDSMHVISQLPDLETLDLSYCTAGSSSRGGSDQAAAGGAAAAAGRHASMLVLLQGSHPLQRQQQNPITNPSSSSPISSNSAFFCKLQRLICIGGALQYDVDLWAALPGLTHLDLCKSERLRGGGMSQLQQLQRLALQGCHQLDYDALALVLTHCSCLTHLDLQGSTVILDSSGTTAMLLQQGTYRSPKAAAAAAAGQAGYGSSSSSSRSRRDAVGADTPTAELDLHQSTAAVAAAAKGLRILLMSGCGLALEGLAWHSLPENPNTPQDPALLLYDLVNRSKWGLSNLTVLQWSQCTHHLLEKILPDLVPSASKTLLTLNLSSSTLPKDPAQCWQGLATATTLKTLDLSHIGFSRHGYANACGQNPTVALLAAIACIKGLEELNLAGLRFYFANFHVLAGLSGLRSLDLSGARDMTDGALWSLTHLTGLTKLDLSAAAPSNPHIWGLIFFHLAQLQHLILSNAVNFTSRSVIGLTQLKGLTALDIQGTKAGDQAAVVHLAGLPNCKQIALTLTMPNSCYNSSRRRSAESLAYQAEVFRTSSLGSDAGQSGPQAQVQTAAAVDDSVEPESSSICVDTDITSASHVEAGDTSSLSSFMHQLAGRFWHKSPLQHADNQPPAAVAETSDEAGPSADQSANILQQGDVAPPAAVVPPAQPPCQDARVLQQRDHHQQQQQLRLDSASRSDRNMPLEPMSNQSGVEASDPVQSLRQYGFVAEFGRCQSLRQLVLGAGPLVAQYCRTLLPPWIDVR